MKNISIYIDLFFCLIVFPMMVAIFPVERWFHNFPWYVMTVGLWLYLVYFLNRIMTVPFLFSDKSKRWFGTVFILVSMTITYILSQVTLYTPKNHFLDVGIFRLFPNIQQYQQAVWTLFMIVESFSLAVGLLTQTNYQRARRRAAEAERDKAEIALYKAQIKPHFMFNTLNSLYGLFLTNNNNALAALEKFISMMKYIHRTSQCDFVAISDEADYIRQYVEVQSLRLNEMTKVELNIDIEDDSFLLPPMLLVTFVENCFKHGVSSVEKSNIHISLRERGGYLHFNTKNSIFPVRRIGEHMGVENCKKRLDLLYTDCHDLKIDNDGEYYEVKLEMSLQK